MFRLIKIIFNAFLLVLAIIGFNAIGGQKYVEAVKVSVGNFIQEHALEGAKKIGNFSGLNEEFQIDNSVNLVGYKAVIYRFLLFASCFHLSDCKCYLLTLASL